MVKTDTLKKLTVDKLKKLAKRAGVKRYSSMKKSQLVRSLSKKEKRYTKSRRVRRSKRKSQSKRRTRKSKSRRGSKAKSKERLLKSKKSTKRRSTKRRSVKNRKGSPPKSPKGTKRVSDIYKGKSNDMNKFFDRIFIINLKDKTERFNKVTKQFHKQGVKYMRFNAVDGRCKDKECNVKKRQFEKKYKIKIANKIHTTVASLVVGTIQILREQVRNKWDHVLICEDDIEFGSGIHKKFSQGIKDLPDDWDLLYLGCGNQCGHKDISDKKTKSIKHKTSLSIVSEDYDWYVKNKDDLRTPCDEDECPSVDDSKYLTYPASPGGGWAYCYSLSGAKKFLKFIGKTIKDHIDQLLIKAVKSGKMEAIAFDPPIIFHEKGYLRPDSDLVWDSS